MARKMLCFKQIDHLFLVIDERLFQGRDIASAMGYDDVVFYQDSVPLG